MLDWSDPPFAKWYTGATINAAVNCVGEPEHDKRDVTYAQLKDEVCQATNALIELGVKKGDRVAIYLPNDPGGGRRHAGVRAPGGTTHGGLRRLLGRRVGLAHRGLWRGGGDHLRRWAIGVVRRRR